MNRFIYLAILTTLHDDIILEESEADTNMKIEEYLEWLRHSEIRFDKKYKKYINQLEKLQSYYLLRQKEKGYKYIEKLLRTI